MKLRRRTNPILALILVGVSAVLLARAFGLIPDGMFDLIGRAWPSLLILIGLAGLLRQRIPWAGLIALVLTAGLVAGLAAYALDVRAGQQRADTQQAIEQVLPPAVTLLRVRVVALDTDVELRRAIDGTAVVAGMFVGSQDNQVISDYSVGDDGSVTLTLEESRSGAFPRLETVGRGTLQIDLPPAVPMDVEFVNQNGDITLNLSGTQLERLNVNAPRGDVLVTLPEYQPRLSERGDMLGVIAAQNGSLTLRVPAAVAARLELTRAGSGIEPQYDPSVYNYLVGDVLESRAIETAAIVLRYSLVAPRGTIRLDVP